MTPGYLTALRQSIRTCEKSEKSEISPQGTPLISLNSLFSHPELLKKPTEGEVIGQGDDTGSTTECFQPSETEAAKKAKKAKKGSPSYDLSFSTLERRCPDFVEAERWQQAVEDGRRFLASWGGQAKALGWTAGELFGLHSPPVRPAVSYSRLSRYTRPD